MVSGKSRQPARFGAEVWSERFGRDWSLWDLWYCVVIELDHDGDPDSLRQVFVEAIRSPGYGSGRDAEAMLNHLDDLLLRLAEVDRRPGEVPGPDVFADKSVVKRARDKVGGRVSLEWRAKTEPMLNTPRVLVEAQARFGWDAFGSDPARFYERLRPIADGKCHVNKYESFDVVDRLVSRLTELDGPRRTMVDRVSLYRAFHTAGLVLADRTDDSHGNVGEARTAAWETYLSLDWHSAGIEPAAYWRDLCALLIWEPYALDHRGETAWFIKVHADEIGLVAQILREFEAELRSAILDWEADRALEAVAHLYLATGHSDGSVDAVTVLGSRSWQPIVAMAEHVIRSGDRNIAAKVFDAADQSGFHQKLLADRRASLGVNR